MIHKVLFCRVYVFNADLIEIALILDVEFIFGTQYSDLRHFSEIVLSYTSSKPVMSGIGAKDVTFR